MTGLYLLVVAGIWLAAVLLLSTLVASKVSPAQWSSPVRVLIVVVLLPLPLIDEIVGGRQFEQLCAATSEIQIDAASTAGRTVWFGDSQRTQFRVGAIQVTQARRNYVDAKTQEPIYHYFRLETKGGWLVSHLGISEGGSPLLFNAVCQPKHLGTIDSQLGLIRVNRPTSN
jgi:hypothetical protein